MSVTLLKFKDYLNIPIQSQDGTQSRGIATIRRSDILSQNIIQIPVNTRFSVATGQTFQNPEPGELNESQTFIPLLLQSVEVGLNQNIPAVSEWNTPIAGITVYNGQPFSGGQDVIFEQNTTQIMNQFKVPSDSIIQQILDLSQKKCLGIIGKDTVPDTPTFDLGVYFLGRYYIETMSKEGYQAESNLDSEGNPLFKEKKNNEGIQGDRVHSAVLRILTGMLSGDRDPTAFMPEVTNEAS